MAHGHDSSNYESFIAQLCHQYLHSAAMPSQIRAAPGCWYKNARILKASNSEQTGHLPNIVDRWLHRQRRCCEASVDCQGGTASKQAECKITHHEEALGKGAKHSRVNGDTLLFRCPRGDVLCVTMQSS